MTAPAEPRGTVTGLPWGIFHSPGENFFEIHDAEGLEVATFYYGALGAPWADPDPADRATAEQRAAFIVQACNAFGPLVEALEGLLASDICYRASGHIARCGFDFDGVCTPPCSTAQVALRLAKGGSPCP